MSRERNSRLVYSTDPAAAARPEAAPAASASGPRRPSSGVRLRLERRASGRVVTSVSGLPGTAAELAELARLLKSRCGAGGTTKDGVLELQGDHRDALEDVLRQRGIACKRAG